MFKKVLEALSHFNGSHKYTDVETSIRVEVQSQLPQSNRLGDILFESVSSRWSVLFCRDLGLIDDPSSDGYIVVHRDRIRALLDLVKGWEANE